MITGQSFYLWGGPDLSGMKVVAVISDGTRQSFRDRSYHRGYN